MADTPALLAASPLSLTIKVDLDGEIRRVKGWPEAHSSPTVMSLEKRVCELFELPTGSLSFKYRDDEGDLCSLAEPTLPDALSLTEASGESILRLIAYRIESTSPLSLAPSASPASEANLVQPRDPPSEATLADTPANPVDVPASEVSAHDISRQSSCGAMSRLDRAKPRLTEGLERFKQQVAQDFHSTREDMKGAFSPMPRDEPPPAIRKIGNVVGAFAGVFAAGRMAPIRATRLAAESYAALREPGDVGEPAPTVASPTSTQATGGVASVSAASQQAEDASVRRELQHFASQVTGDFETARREVRDVFGCIMGAGTPRPGVASSAATQAEQLDQHQDQSSAAQQQQQQEQQQEEQGYKQIVPGVVSTFAAVSVAASLVTLRAARLAVAASGALIVGSGAEAAQHAAEAGAEADTRNAPLK